jgi:geranyl-CoA carboxylase alpha subunit
MTPIRKLLIANRGEIARRILRTARSRGIKTVAVYSDADAGALHVRMADEAVHIGGAAAAESYLRIDAVIEAAKQTGAHAIHPGYGFLSERADFAAACEEAGIVFVGPTAAAIAAMGDKAEAKRRMIAAGVPCVPGYQGEEQAEARLVEEAEKIGFPVMVKAAAGGGGRGMRVVEKAAELKAALASARKEAENAFGDGRLLIEKAVVGAHHVEVQVIADAHGHVLHLGERDCSLQRRRQKVIEEAPSPVITADIRERMGAAAVEAACAAGYRNAGTVEFLYDPKTKEFYFLEMNTRLQVEHPVTELVTGLDLVALQLDVAEGKALPLAQEDVRLNGWAIEARLYAEDPAHGFLPQTGRITLLDFPSFSLVPFTGEGPGVRGRASRRPANRDTLTPNPSPASGRGECAARDTAFNEWLRVDAGVETGDEVSAFYDPMIAKVIAFGATRDEARERLATALEETAILGIATNAALLVSLLRDETFARGAADIDYIEANLDRLNGEAATVSALEVALAACVLLDVPHDHLLTGWNSRGSSRFPLKLQHGEETIEAHASVAGASITAELGEEAAKVEIVESDGARLRFRSNGAIRSARVLRSGEAADLQLGPVSRRFVDITYAPAGEAASGADVVKAPMAGAVTGVLVKSGDAVTKGQTVATIEAMKMEHKLAAPRGGIVETVSVAVGDQVAIRAAVVRLRGFADG